MESSFFVILTYLKTALRTICSNYADVGRVSASSDKGIDIFMVKFPNLQSSLNYFNVDNRERHFASVHKFIIDSILNIEAGMGFIF